MSISSEILSDLPIDQLAEQVGASPEETEAAVRSVVPALLGGMEANIQDPGGQSALLDALGSHVDAPMSLSDVDTNDGEKIAQHVFGNQQDAVVNQLGGLPGTSSDIVRKLLPIIAPLVISYLAKRVMGGSSTQAGGPLGGANGGSNADILSQILSGVLGGSAPTQQAEPAQPQSAPTPQQPTTDAAAPQQSAPQQPQQQSSAPNWGDILGGLLGGGTKI